jgi:hypothetical protein
MSQLTITLDDKLLQDAQAYARLQGQKLDDLVAHLLEETVRLAAPASETPATAVEQSIQGLSPRIQRLYGSLKAPADFDYKKELEDGLAEKYGLRSITS